MQEIHRLKNHQFAQCYVIESEYSDGSKARTFISDRTPVIEVHYSTKLYPTTGSEVKFTGTYSVTTARQITWYMREYLPDLSLADMKKIIGKGFVEM